MKAEGIFPGTVGPRREQARLVSALVLRPRRVRPARGRARTAAALLGATLTALWLALAWASAPAPGIVAPPEIERTAETGRLGRLALVEQGQPAPAVDLARSDGQDGREGLATVGRSADDDPLLAVLARLASKGRADDRTAEVPGWPIFAPDPDREAPSTAAAEARSEGHEVHVVAPGETLLGIAAALGVSEDQLVKLNQLSDRDRIYAGQRLAIPARGDEVGRARVSSRGATLRPRFDWPLRGDVTTYFGEVGAVWIGGRHTGLDIAGREGDPLVAAEAGVVREAGWAATRGFGNYVLIDHGLGYRTTYGHLSAIAVKAGQEVRRGQRIGEVGSTGVSTGPHLHFELTLDGKPVDPLEYLP